MSTERINYLLRKKWQEVISGEGQSPKVCSLEDTERRVKLLKHLGEVLEWIMDPPQNIELMMTYGEGKVVDSRIMEDPVGARLYEFGWEGKAPDYVREDWFVQERQAVWTQLGESGWAEFKARWRMVGDRDTCAFLDDASKEELSCFRLEMDEVYEEKCRASAALFSMANRTLRRETYLKWANRFKLLSLQKQILSDPY